MTLSHIHLPSISFVLTSNHVVLPGHSPLTKPDSDAPEITFMPCPDYLMETIHLDEAAPSGDQVSSFGIKRNLDTIKEQDELAATTDKRSSTSTSRGAGPRSSSSSKKHGRGASASSFQILYPIKFAMSFARRGRSKGKTLPS